MSEDQKSTTKTALEAGHEKVAVDGYVRALRTKCVPKSGGGAAWHWLYHAPSGTIMPVRWSSRDAWHFADEWRNEWEMAKDGWSYLAPAIPPATGDHNG